MRRTLAPVAFAAVLAGCSLPDLPPDPWFRPDRLISPADTVRLATLYCECVPYQCEGSSAQESRLLAAVRYGRGVSMADVDRFGSVRECKTSLFRGVDIPGAEAKLRAFKATVRPVNE